MIELAPKGERQEDCSCGRSYSELNGEIWIDRKLTAWYRGALLDHGARRLWIAIGTQDPSADDRLRWVSIETWFSEDGFHSRVTDGGESPWQHKIDGRDSLLDRQEVMSSDGMTEWHFSVVDALTEQPPVRAFLAGD